jgi:8-oxo-dGTP diphosphatase
LRDEALMRFLERLEQATLALVYGMVMWLRNVFWRVRRPILVGVRALIVRNQMVLLIRHRYGRQPWGLPGGGVERNEPLMEAVRREACEESGVHIEIQYLLGVYDRFKDGVSNYVGVFVCAPLNEPDPPYSLEIAEARFFPVDQVPTGVDDASRRRIDEYLRGERGISREW